MKSGTSLNYHQRIEKVLSYIVINIAGDLSVESLAGVAHFSPYHFHRVYRAITGETIGDTIRRVRLGVATKELRNSSVSVSTVALNCGFETTESFSRAFRKGLGLSPSAYKKFPYQPVLLGQPSRVMFDPNTMKIHLTPLVEGTAMQFKVETKKPIRYAYMSHTGPYQEIGKVFYRLLAWSAEQGIDLDAAEIFSQSYDSPRATPRQKLRSEACIAVPETIAPSEGVKIASRQQQRYIVYTHQGHYDGIQDTYHQMLLHGLADMNEEMADAPFVEVYKNDCNSLPPGEWLTDLCIPIK